MIFPTYISIQTELNGCDTGIVRVRNKEWRATKIAHHNECYALMSGEMHVPLRTRIIYKDVTRTSNEDLLWVIDNNTRNEINLYWSGWEDNDMLCFRVNSLNVVEVLDIRTNLPVSQMPPLNHLIYGDDHDERGPA